MDQAAIMAVQRMQEYIEQHLQEPITLKALATVANYSPWHAARLFKEITERAPFEYIRALRLSKAALILRDRPVKVMEVALDFVFDSHEGFTRAFTKTFGISPHQYQQSTPPVRLFMPSKVYDTYLILNQGASKMTNTPTKTVFVQVMERPARKLLLKRGIKATDYFEYCEEVACDVWSVLTSVKEALYEPVGVWLPKHLIVEGTSMYCQGVEVPMDYQNTIPEGFDLIDLPACQMMVFQGESYDDEVFMEAIDEVWQHIEKFDPTIYGYQWAVEDGPRIQLEPMGYRGYIEALPVRAINR